MFRKQFVLMLGFLVVLFWSGCNKTDDATITTDIQAKMFADPVLKSAPISVATKDGVVTITGQVPDDAARAAARNIASQTKGVKQVIDSTLIAPQGPPTDITTQSVAAPSEPAPAHEKRARAKKHTAEAAPAAAVAPEPAPAQVPPAVESAQAEPAALPPVPPAPVTPPPPPQPITVTIPESTIVTVRTSDAIDSSTSSTGQTFRASLDAPIVVGDEVVVPKGLNVTLKLVNASSAGKFKGSSELTVSLESFAYQGKTYTVSTSDVQEKGASRGKRSAEVIGGGAALGALIGGLAGGGKGAAIGAGVGAGGGTAVQALTKGQQVKIPSETRLDFTLHAPVEVTYVPHQKPSRAAPAGADSSQPVDGSTPQ